MDDLRQQNCSNPFETEPGIATANFVIGPPTRPKAREAFETYQKAKNNGDDEAAAEYQKIIERSIRELFEPEGETPSVIDEYVEAMLEQDLHVELVLVGPGYAKGKWVTSVQAEVKAELSSAREVWRLVAQVLGETQSAEWLHLFHNPRPATS